MMQVMKYRECGGLISSNCRRYPHTKALIAFHCFVTVKSQLAINGFIIINNAQIKKDNNK